MGIGIFKTLGPLVIASGTANSNAISGHTDCAAISIQSPAVLDADTFVLQVSRDAVTWANYQEGSTLTDVPLPAAGKAAVYQLLACFKYFRIRDSSGNVAADRTWLVSGVATV